MKIIKKVIVLTLLVSIALSTTFCSSDKAASSASFSDFKEAFKVNATLIITNGEDQTLDGYATIDTNNNIVLDFIEGTIRGTAQNDGDNYIINITQYEGVFRNMNSITGSIDTSNNTLSLTGLNIDNTSIAIIGSLDQLLGVDGDYLIEWGNTHSKSAFVFRNYGTCAASITLNGVTLNGITPGYVTSSSCRESGMLFAKFPVDVENEESNLVCTRIRLLALGGGGSYVDVEQCESARFIIDKNVNYDYTIEWENGDTATGTTGELLGGRLITKCIGVDDPSCGSSEPSPGQATLFFDGSNKVGAVSEEVDDSPFCDPARMITISAPNCAVYFFFVPSVQSANFTTSNADCQFYISGYMDLDPFTFQSVTGFIGTFTWTGTNSFEFSCSWTKDGQTHSLTGQGLLP